MKYYAIDTKFRNIKFTCTVTSIIEQQSFFHLVSIHICSKSIIWILSFSSKAKVFYALMLSPKRATLICVHYEELTLKDRINPQSSKCNQMTEDTNCIQYLGSLSICSSDSLDSFTDDVKHPFKKALISTLYLPQTCTKHCDHSRMLCEHTHLYQSQYRFFKYGWPGPYHRVGRLHKQGWPGHSHKRNTL